jgi:hypothetical protein
MVKPGSSLQPVQRAKLEYITRRGGATRHGGALSTIQLCTQLAHLM